MDRYGQPIPSTSAACWTTPEVQRSVRAGLDDLPTELLITLMKYLDQRDKLMLGLASNTIQNMFFNEPIKILKREINDAEILNTDNFKNIAHLVTEIELFGVTNFNTQSKKAFTLMKNLVKVDLTCTNIYCEDYEDLLPNTVKYLTAAVTRKDDVIQSNPLSHEYIMNYIRTIPNVHFYVKDEMTEFMFQDLSITQNIKISCLSSSLEQSFVKMQGQDTPKFRTLQFSLNMSAKTRMSLLTGYMNLIHVEFLLYNYDSGRNKPMIFCSPYVSNLVIENKNIFRHINFESMSVICQNHKMLPELALRHHIRLLMWNKCGIRSKQLDEVIREDIRKNIPSHVCAHDDIHVPLILNKYNDECVIYVSRSRLHERDDTHSFDFEFVEKYNFKHVVLLNGCVCGFDPSLKSVLFEPFEQAVVWSRLKYVTTLNISGLTFVNNIWQELFTECTSLTTLVVCNSLMALSINHDSIAEHMQRAPNLKYFKLLEKNLCLNTIILGAAKCSNLEMLHICSLTVGDLHSLYDDAVETLKAGCPKLGMALLKNCPMRGTRGVPNHHESYVHLVDAHRFKLVDVMHVNMMDYTSIFFYPTNFLFYDDYDYY